MQASSWLLLAGALMFALAAVGTVVKRLPISAAMVYLAVGFVAGKLGVRFDPLEQGSLFHHLTEVVLIVSIFATSLKLRTAWKLSMFSPPLRLGFVAMLFTVLAVAAAGVVGLGLSLGVALVLGGALAPTDPLLASDAQVEHPGDGDRLRVALTGEAAINDGAAWPMVLLGLGLISHGGAAGEWVWKWAAVDALWAVLGGPLIGALMGTAVAKGVLWLRTQRREAVGSDDFLALGLIGLSYGVAVKLHASGFLAVAAAALALRHMELAGERRNGDRPPPEVLENARGEEAEERKATHPATAKAYMADAVLGFADKLERAGEAVVIVLTGVLLANLSPSPHLLWFVPLLFFVIRPAAVFAGLIGSDTSLRQRALTGWLGLRGIASLYYLFFAASRGLPPEATATLASIVVPTLAASVFLHGISVTPLMRRYKAGQEAARA